MKIARFVLTINFLFVLLLPVSRVKAQVSSCPGTETGWEQLRTETFAMIYPQNGIDREILIYYQERLDSEYRRISSLFQTDLILPVNLRVYARDDDYYCLNNRAARLPNGFVHTRVGNREIALIQEDIHEAGPGWRDAALNALRHELSALLAEHLTDHKIPPGLAAGVGGYLQDPNYLIQSRPKYGWSRDQSPGWQRLWEDSATATDGTLLVEATSIVAFLVERSGWPALVQFLKAIATAEDELAALSAVYNASADELETAWLDYAGYYLGGRWQSHALYNYDLSGYEELLQAGAYEDAAAGLKEAIAFLDSVGNAAAAAQARQLLDKAKTGQMAGALAAQARQALLEQKYGQSLVLARQADAQYQSIPDTRRVKELQTYREWAEEVLQLRGEVEQARAQFAAQADLTRAAHLQQVGQRLDELGDEQGLAEVQALLAQMDSAVQQRLQTRYWIGAGLVLVLLAARLALLFRRKRAEVLL